MPVADEVARIECSTSAGDIVLELHRRWSPAGYDRAVQLFARHFYDQSHFFRTVPNFLVQFGISYSEDTALQQIAKTPIPDDPQLDPPVRFTEGSISYAGKRKIRSLLDSACAWLLRMILAMLVPRIMFLFVCLF